MKVRLIAMRGLHDCFPAGPYSDQVEISLNRRQWLAGSATALALASTSEAASASPHASRRATSVAAGLRSQRSAVIDGDVTPLCGVVAGAVQRFQKGSDTLYEETILEVAHYTDPTTGALLDTITMPGTGRSVAVPAYRFGPIKARFAVAHDECEEFEPAQYAYTALTSWRTWMQMGEIRGHTLCVRRPGARVACFAPLTRLVTTRGVP